MVLKQLDKDNLAGLDIDGLAGVIQTQLQALDSDADGVVRLRKSWPSWVNAKAAATATTAKTKRSVSSPFQSMRHGNVSTATPADNKKEPPSRCTREALCQFNKRRAAVALTPYQFS